MNYIINLNKPSDITSRQAVTKVKQLLGADKAGHTGTLDPLATGILLICLNEATKVTRFLLDMDKTYKAKMKFGERTDTCDATGRIIEKKDISSLTEFEILNAVAMFRGRIRQKPPMYSAVKVRGETLYKLARRGIEIERPERVVEIYDIKVLGINFPYCDLMISCSKGTYVRSLCDDMGRSLGVGAHIVALERQTIGFFDIKDTVSFEDLLVYKNEKIFCDGEKHSGVCRAALCAFEEKSFCSIDFALSGLKEIFLGERDYKRARQGIPIISNNIGNLHENDFIRMKGPSGNLFGIGRACSDVIRIERILNL